VTANAFLASAIKGKKLELSASGSWTAGFAGEIDQAISGLIWTGDTRSVRVHMEGVQGFDTFGAWLLERLRRESESRGHRVEIVGMPDHDRRLFEGMRDVTLHRVPKRTVTQRVLDSFETLGRNMTDFGRDLTAFTNLLGGFCVSLGRVTAMPHTFRLTSAVHQLDKVGWQAVPIILLITFLIGAIIAQQGIFHFRQFGADIYVVDMVGILVLREVGVLLVAIMVAGRSGSAYTAELGSMKMREEVDALRTMGFSPIDILILPRVIALICALPILTFLGSIAALYGGGLVAWFYGGMSPEIFVERLRDAISLTHFKVGMVKAPFMGLVIGIIACTEGLRVKGSAESLGLQTTKSVVKSIFAVIVLDGLFAIFFASIGM